MLATHLIAVGRLRPAFREACDDYMARLLRYGPFTEREVKEAGDRPRPEERIREETRRIQDALPDRSIVVVLDRRGHGPTTEQLASRLDQWRATPRPLALVIGGAFGLDADRLERTDYRWSLGPLTLPHELARVIVLEQIYRAWSILSGEPYHK